MKLKKKVAIVTGGGGFIGRAAALRLSSEGASVAVCDISMQQAETVAGEIRNLGGEAAAIEVNIRKTSEISRMTETVISRFGRVDILVNVAGGSARGDHSMLHLAKEEVIDRVLEVNLRGTIFCSRAVIGQMIEQKGGKIINIASINGVAGKAGYSDYSAAKGGVIALTKALAMELGRYGINVNCISPGLVPRTAVKDPEFFHRTNYLGKIGKPEEIASLVLFLASDEADFITGQNYIIDGGRSLGLKGDG